MLINTRRKIISKKKIGEMRVKNCFVNKKMWNGIFF